MRELLRKMSDHRMSLDLHIDTDYMDKPTYEVW
jgi:hypothetical protein